MTRNKLRALGFLISAALIGPGCGSNDAGGPEDEEVGQATEALAPTGSNAQLVSTVIPTTMAPGERRLFTVTMKNTGATAPANNWTASSPQYALSALNSNFNWNYDYVTSTIAVGANRTFTFAVTAPPVSATFQARMTAIGGGVFGDTVSVPVTVSAATTPQWRCGLVSTTLPTTLTPGENRVVSFTVRNTGTATWPATNLKLVTRDNPANTWGAATTSDLTAAVAPNGTATFSFNIVAPSTAGTFTFQREMKDYAGIGDFKDAAPFCVDKAVTIGGTALLNAAVVSNTFPTTMSSGQVSAVTAVMRNTGSETWLPGGNYGLYSVNTPVNLWGPTVVNVGTATVTSTTATFNFSVTAPPTPGNYVHSWQMRKIGGAGAGAAYFGAIISVPVTVNAAPVPLAATVVSQSVPTLMTVSGTYVFTITMRNTGTQAWTGPTYMLYTANSPATVWQTFQIPLAAGETIAPNATKAFTFAVKAPAAPGNYASNWRMRLTTSGVFGNTATTTPIVVTNCGNGVLNTGEQCDDGNLVSGDDCSSTCQIEQIIVDPNSTPRDRTLFGTGTGAQVAPVTIGDVTGDGKLDVLTSQSTGAPGTGTNKGGAGSIYGFTTQPFLNGGNTVVTAANFYIGGVEANDLWGGTSNGGRIIIGNVAGSAVADVIVSSSIAAGAGNSRTGAGEIYVIAGGSGLATAGLINLAANPLPASVVAHVTGATGDHVAALGVGTLVGGDAIPDLLVGTPGHLSGAGALYILKGPLSGEIDLTAPPAGTVIISGTGVDQLGTRAAIGDINNDGVMDILAGCSSSTFGSPSRSAAGSAYAKFGPFSTNVNFALAAGAAGGPSVVWRGRSANDNFGNSVAIGNVTGTAQNEVLIGAIQLRKNPAVATDQYGGVAVYSNPTGTLDLASTPATILIEGVDLKDNCGTALATGKVSGGTTYDDIVVSCSAADGPANGRTDIGEIHIIRGRATFPAIWDMATHPSSSIIYGRDNGGAIGRVAGNMALADLDTDGFIDICGGSINGFSGSVKTGHVDCYSSPF